MRQLLLIICRFPPLICTYHKFKKPLGAKKSLEHLDVDTSSMSCLHPSLVGGFLPICCCFRPIEMMLHNGTQDSLPAIENGFNPPYSCGLHPHVCHANLNVHSWKSIWVCRITWVYPKSNLWCLPLFSAFKSPILRQTQTIYPIRWYPTRSHYISSHPMAPHYITMVSRIGCTRAGPKEEEQQELFGDAGRDGYLQQRIHRRRGLADLGLKKKGAGEKNIKPPGSENVKISLSLVKSQFWGPPLSDRKLGGLRDLKWWVKPWW